MADQPARVRALVGALRARIDLARTILSDPVSARAYAQRARASAGGDPAGGMTQQVCAEAEMRRGEALLERGRARRGGRGAAPRSRARAR